MSALKLLDTEQDCGVALGEIQICQDLELPLNRYGSVILLGLHLEWLILSIASVLQSDLDVMAPDELLG